MDGTLFGNPWEHIRLLSDDARNAVLVGFLERHAPDNRVLEVGCGTGVLSAVAARLGATHVVAVEPTEVADIASALARDNGLPMTVVRARIEDVAPEDHGGPVDVAFSELLNADPFFEGVVEVTNATRRWVKPDGLLAPSRLTVWAAAVRASDSAREARAARRAVSELGRRFDLQMGAVLDGLKPDATSTRPHALTDHTYVTLVEEPVGPGVVVHDLALGDGSTPETTVRVELPVTEAGPVSGVMLWFEAVMDDDLVLHNRPEDVSSHWGRQVCVFPTERGVRAGGHVTIELTLANGALHVVDCT